MCRPRPVGYSVKQHIDCIKKHLGVNTVVQPSIDERVFIHVLGNDFDVGTINDANNPRKTSDWHEKKLVFEESGVEWWENQ